MKIIRLWRLARRLQEAADRGDVMITVPRWLAPELESLIWARNVDRAAEKWAGRTAEVPLDQWQAAIRDRLS